MLVFKLSDKFGGPRTLEQPPGQACDLCKQRKVKCDRLKPCGACQASYTDCYYKTAPRRRGRPPIATTKRLRAKEHGIQSVSSADGTPLSYSMGLFPHQAGGNTGILPSTDAEFAQESFQDEIVSGDLFLGNLTGSCQMMIEYPAESSPGATLNSTRQVVIDGQYPLAAYTNWTTLFLMRLYPIFPVINPGCLLRKLSLSRDAVPRSIARFFAAMSAAVIVQLNIDANGGAANDKEKGTNPPSQAGTPASLADQYIAQCAAERQADKSFIDEADEWTILESFFTFAYYGNRNKSRQAWYFLREAIGFAISMGLDREQSYGGSDIEANEQRRLIYWLLFITERAYCLQHRARPMLQPSIALPCAYNGCDEVTLKGFVDLITLFVLVDSAFMASWCAQSIQGVETNSNLMNRGHSEEERYVIAVNETQKVDILVTECWLHTLAWRLQPGRLDAAVPSLRRAARRLVCCFSGTPREAIESHGIGMEQKLSDIADFMCDLLPTAEQENLTMDTDSVPNLLHNIMCLLANFRNVESCYLGPLAEKATISLMLHGDGLVNYQPLLGFTGSGSQNTGQGGYDEMWDDIWEPV